MKNLLLIRGLSREKRHWGEFPSQIEQSLRFKVHTLDNLGVGEFNRRNSPVSVEENVDFLQDQFESLESQYPGEWYLLGISLGGMFAIEWSQRINPFKKVFIINSSIKNYSPLFHRLSPYAIKMMTKYFLLPKEKQEEIIYDLTSVKTHSCEHGFYKIREWLNYRDERPMNKINFFRQLAAAAQYRLVKKPDNKMVFISSKEDALCHWKCGQNMAKFCDSPFYLCEKPAGHDLPMDCPEFIIDVLSKEVEFSRQYIREAETITENLSAL